VGPLSLLIRVRVLIIPSVSVERPKLQIRRLGFATLALERTYGTASQAADKTVSTRLRVRDLSLPPSLDLSPHGFEVSLDLIYSHGKCVNQIEAPGVLGQDGSEHAWDNVPKCSTKSEQNGNILAHLDG
jgi:hypothetical protein